MPLQFVPLKQRLRSTCLFAIHYQQVCKHYVLVMAVSIILLFAPANTHAQDTLGKASAQKGIAQLQRSLSRNVETADEAKALFKTAGSLNYQAGQVMALCRLACVYDRGQQTAQAKLTLQNAARQAAKVTNVNDAEWAMEAATDLQEEYTTPSNDFKTGLGAVMVALGRSLAKGTLGLNDKQLADFQDGQKLSAQISTQIKKILVRTAKPGTGINGSKSVMDNFADLWLDTMINKGTPANVKKLTTQKKKRDAVKALSSDFASKGNYAQAYKYFLQYTAYKDSLTLEATSRRLAGLAYQQKLLKKQAQINLLTKDGELRRQKANRQLQLMFGLFGFIALLVTILVILGRNNQSKKRVNLKLNKQKEELQQALAELKTTQQQLIQSEKMASLGELTAGIAHEIQNPLNFVNNFSEVSTELVRELIEDHEKGDHETEAELYQALEQNLEKITEHGHRASSIIKGMLEHSRSSSGQKQPTDLNSVVEEYLKLSYHGMRARDKFFEASLVTKLDSDLGNVNMVPQEIGRVLLNIFNNSFYAIQQRKKTDLNGYKPLLTVKTFKENGQAKIIINDNGKGIPEPIKQKIFQPFFTTKPTGEGTGLGLSLSYDVITKGHGGEIKVESQENSFTEFTLTLPV